MKGSTRNFRVLPFIFCCCHELCSVVRCTWQIACRQLSDRKFGMCLACLADVFQCLVEGKALDIA